MSHIHSHTEGPKHQCDLVFLNESKKLRLCRFNTIIMFGNNQSKTPFMYSLKTFECFLSKSEVKL